VHPSLIENKNKKLGALGLFLKNKNKKIRNNEK
jgi:hypothetical protein